MTSTNFRRPRTGDKLLRIQFRNGETCEGIAANYRFTDTGGPFDIVAVEVVKGAKA